MNKYIDEALDDIRLRAEKYLRSERYYEGRHDLAFATDKFKTTFGSLFREFALNLCPAICDAVRDKLRVTGFSPDTEAAASSDPVRLATHVRRIWNANGMRHRAGEVHKEALKCGDAYVIIWPDERGRATIFPNRAANCTVTYDDEQPGRIVRAAKYWRTAEKRFRLNLFYPDRIEKYITTDTCEGALPEPGKLVPFAGSAVIDNPYGVVPVFHFANNADLALPGRSELEPALPIQDGLNKSVLDMLVAMEYAAFRQRWAAGIEVEYDAAGEPVAPFKSGADHIWMSQNADTRFGDFNTAALDQFLLVKDSFRIDMALVSGTPLHYFTPNLQGFHSGENLKQSESRFLAKVRDRQSSFGQIWADVMRFALTVEGRPDETLLTEWEDPAPTSDRELLENILLKKQIGLPVEQALIEAGYGEADAKRMVKGSIVE